MHVGEAEVASGVAVSEALMVDAELVQEGGVEVVDFDGVLDGVFADVVGLTMNVTGFEAAASDPDGEAVAMVPATVFALASGGAAELGGPQYEGVVQHAALFEIGDEGGGGLIDVVGEVGVLFHVAVRVPVGAGAGVDEFDETDAALGETAGDEALPSEVGTGAFDRAVEAVEMADVGGFLAEVEGFGGGLLHLESGLEGFDASG